MSPAVKNNEDIKIIKILNRLKVTHDTHGKCCGALRFCFGALCKVSILIYIFLIVVPLARGKLLCPLIIIIIIIVIKIKDSFYI